MTANPNKALWEKGDFTRIAESMRESGEALVKDPGNHRRARGPGPRLRRRDHGAARGEARRGRPRCRHRQQPRRGGQRARTEPRPRQLPVPGGRRVRSERARGRQLRPRRQHLRRDVRAEAVRRGQGDGSRDAARRPDRDGQLDPQRPDARRADPEDQLRLLAASAGRVRQPHDLGRRGPRDRAIRRRRRPEENISFERDTYTFNFPGPPAEFLVVFRTYYGPTMNAFEAAEPTAARPICRPSWRPSSTARTRARTRTPPRSPQPSCA